MNTSPAQYTKIILLSLVLFQCNALFTNEKFLARHNKLANDFIQKFPRMTLPEAGKKMNALEPLTKRMVWHKVEQNSFKNNNDILSTALLLTQMPLEMQYLIFTEDFGSYKIKRLAPGEKGRASIIEISDEAKKTLTTSSIYELFRWKAVINKKYKDNDSLAFIKVPPYDYDNQRYSNLCLLNKAELFYLTLDEIKVLEKMFVEDLTKKELTLLTKLPPKILEKINSRSLKNSDNLKFHYHYRKALNMHHFKEELFNVNKVLIPTIVGLLLYSHFFIGKMYDYIPTQDPIALAHNAKLEAENAAIETLQKNGAPGAELLSKRVITEVPLEHPLKSYVPGLLPGSIFGLAMLNDGVVWGIVAFGATTVIFNEISSALHYLSSNLFTNGLPIGLSIATLASLCITSPFVLYSLSSAEFKTDSIQPQKDKSLKTLISEHLNNRNIEIRE